MAHLPSLYSSTRKRGLGTNNQLPAVVKGDAEVPAEVTANDSFSTKHTDDYRIYPRVSKLCNLYPAQVGGSKHACDVIG